MAVRPLFGQYVPAIGGTLLKWGFLSVEKPSEAAERKPVLSKGE